MTSTMEKTVDESNSHSLSKDVEKGAAGDTDANGKEENEKERSGVNEIVVDWEGPNDPMNPKKCASSFPFPAAALPATYHAPITDLKL